MFAATAVMMLASVIYVTAYAATLIIFDAAAAGALPDAYASFDTPPPCRCRRC